MRDPTAEQPPNDAATENNNNNIYNSPAAAAKVPLNHWSLRRAMIDVSIFVVLLLPIAICEFAIEPFRRGFFCNDESISYPFRPNTVQPWLLGILLAPLPLVIIIVVEFVRFYNRGEMQSSRSLLGWNAPSWLAESVRQLCYFAVGMIITFDLTELGKFTIGRLRPHFMAVCQPKLMDGSSCSDAQNLHRYIENYECVAQGFTQADVRQSRLSFPSGHSSLIFFGMLYLALYLQQRMNWRGSKLAKHFFQLLLITIAWFTALSRVMDNWHHWSDVLMGSAIGIMMALLTAHYISKLFRVRPEQQQMRLCIPRQDTTTTLDEIMVAGTPPPYSMNSFTNEQYCTKV